MLSVKVDRDDCVEDSIIMSEADQQNIEEYISKNLCHKIKLIDLCVLIGSCVSGLIRKIKATYNVTPHVLVEQRRIERASALLMSSSKSISEISYATGFAHQSHFGQVFKKYMGMAPSNFRAIF